MNNENEIIEDLKNWKELIKPYATPKKLLELKFTILLPFIALVVAAAIVYEYSVWGSVLISVLAGLFNQSFYYSARLWASIFFFQIENEMIQWDLFLVW
jgi:hypothetical protein